MDQEIEYINKMLPCVIPKKYPEIKDITYYFIEDFISTFNRPLIIFKQTVQRGRTVNGNYSLDYEIIFKIMTYEQYLRGLADIFGIDKIKLKSVNLELREWESKSIHKIAPGCVYKYFGIPLVESYEPNLQDLLIYNKNSKIIHTPGNIDPEIQQKIEYANKVNESRGKLHKTITDFKSGKKSAKLDINSLDPGVLLAILAEKFDV